MFGWSSGIFGKRQEGSNRGEKISVEITSKYFGCRHQVSLSNILVHFILYMYTYSAQKNSLNVKRSRSCGFLVVCHVCVRAIRPAGFVQGNYISPCLVLSVILFYKSAAFELVSWLNKSVAFLAGPVPTNNPSIERVLLVNMGLLYLCTLIILPQ